MDQEDSRAGKGCASGCTRASSECKGFRSAVAGAIGAILMFVATESSAWMRAVRTERRESRREARELAPEYWRVKHELLNEQIGFARQRGRAEEAEALEHRRRRSVEAASRYFAAGFGEFSSEIVTRRQEFEDLDWIRGYGSLTPQSAPEYRPRARWRPPVEHYALRGDPQFLAAHHGWQSREPQRTSRETGGTDDKSWLHAPKEYGPRPIPPRFSDVIQAFAGSGWGREAALRVRR